MRPVAIILAALALSVSGTAWAKDDKPPKEPPGQSADHNPPGQNKPDGNTPPGQGDTPPGQQNTPPGQSGTPQGQGGTPPGQGGTPPGQAKKDGDVPPGQQHALTEQDEAQALVESKDALPLTRIVEIAQGIKTGRVIDAKLVHVDGFLLYELTMLDESGRSWRDYFYARTGNPVIIR
jgi:hypothetical protein